MTKYKMVWIFLIAVFLVCDPAIAKTVHDVLVKKVIDGDSILVSNGTKDMKIRLWGIDTPEYRQPYSKAAKKITKKILLHELVDLEVKDIDKYGRTVALVRTKNGENVNELLVRRGYAWVHIYYCKEPICKTWKVYESEAREKKTGLWREANPVAPWIWKRKYKNR